MDCLRDTILIYGRAASGKAHAMRDFLHRAGMPLCWIELCSDGEVRDLLGLDGLGDGRLPVVIFPDGTRLENPDVHDIAEKLGFQQGPTRREYDVCIYGAGPAGLSAAVYAASEGLRTILIERYAVGGQAGSSARIENFLGFPEGISGVEFAARAREQACKFGAEILVLREGIPSPFVPGKSACYIDDGTNITSIVAKAAVYATGVAYRHLNLPGEDYFYGAGLYYGAGGSECAFTTGAHVYLLGGGNSAGQAALQFSRFASNVTLVVRRSSLAETMSEYLITRIETTRNIHVITDTEVTGLHGDNMLRAITLRNKKTGAEQQAKTIWLFVCFGGIPNTGWAEELGVIRDAGGYILTGPDLANARSCPNCWTLKREPYYLETNIPGIFAAGDVRAGSIKRVAAAAGEGAMAITFVHRHLALGDEVSPFTAAPQTIIPKRLAGMGL